MTNESENVTAIDPLAERYRAAFDKTIRTKKQSEAARAQWIEATLELTEVVLQTRERFPDHREFSRWLERYSLPKMDKNDRAALLGMAEDLAAARDLLTTTTHKGFSWDWIWRKRPNRTLPKVRKGTPAPLSRRTGHAHRQRRQRIPTVMQERPYERLQDLVLTREQVDPDFKGTPLEFATKYGHVPLHTKAEKEQNKRQEEVQNWLKFVTSAGQAAKVLMAAPPPEQEVFDDWLRQPGKMAKFTGWIYALETAAARLRKLLPPKTLDEIEAEIDAIGEPPQ